MRLALTLSVLLASVTARAQTPGEAPPATPTRGPGEEGAAGDREPFRDAPGVTPIHESLRDTGGARDTRVRVRGFYRTRGDLGLNWDLGRGPTPSLPSVWPTPYAERAGRNTQTNLDMRLRFDVTADIGWGVSLHGRAHVLDNLRWGSVPDGEFVGGVVNQLSPRDPIQVRQLYAQVLLPFGMLYAGRMGALIDWGTGFFLNAGNGLDDDTGDVGDRIAFVAPLGGLLWSMAYELTASGVGSDALRPEIKPAFDLDPSDDVRTFAFSVSRWDAPATRQRRLDARRTTINFGLLAAYRSQQWDLAAGSQPAINPAIRRDLEAFVGDAWVRADVGPFTFEGELAYVGFRIGNASLDPAAALNVETTGQQLGAVLRADWRQGPRFFARVEFGYASGDSRPGFGARPTSTAARAGDLDGPQFDLTTTPRDANLNNFRFHPNYRVDLIMWRRIIGTVTDAWYVRPMVRARLWSMLSVEASVTGSVAVQPNSTPAGRAPLGVETDIGLVYEQEHGFVARLDYGLLVPLAGWTNVVRGVDPSLAHALHLVMAFRY